MNEEAFTGENHGIKKETLEECLKQIEASKSNERVHKNDKLPSPIVLSGTEVKEGEGWVMAIVVGKSSVVGRILSVLSPMGNQNNLKAELLVEQEKTTKTVKVC